MCLAVENKGIDPFEVNIKEILVNLKKYLPDWKVFEDFTLDAEAINRISSIVCLQGGWIKHRSSSLYVDPLLVELKIRMIKKEELVDAFLKSWHPIIRMEQLSQKRIKESVDYWNLLLPLNDRLMELPDVPTSPGVTTIDELIKSRFMSEESFNDVLQRLYKELKESAGDMGKVSYWDFIQADTYEDTIYRAYLTSFLVTYGYASMEVNPIEEENFLVPFEEPKTVSTKKRMVSIPVSIDYDSWKNMKKREVV